MREKTFFKEALTTPSDMKPGAQNASQSTLVARLWLAAGREAGLWLAVLSKSVALSMSSPRNTTAGDATQLDLGRMPREHTIRWAFQDVAVKHGHEGLQEIQKRQTPKGGRHKPYYFSLKKMRFGG